MDLPNPNLQQREQIKYATLAADLAEALRGAILSRFPDLLQKL